MTKIIGTFVIKKREGNFHFREIHPVSEIKKAAYFSIESKQLLHKMKN